VIRQSLRGVIHVYIAVACGYAALAWRRRGAGWLFERSQYHYDRAQDLLGWMDEDDLPND